MYQQINQSIKPSINGFYTFIHCMLWCPWSCCLFSRVSHRSGGVISETLCNQMRYNTHVSLPWLTLMFLWNTLQSFSLGPEQRLHWSLMAERRGGKGREGGRLRVRVGGGGVAGMELSKWCSGNPSHPDRPLTLQLKGQKHSFKEAPFAAYNQCPDPCLPTRDASFIDTSNQDTCVLLTFLPGVHLTIWPIIVRTNWLDDSPQQLKTVPWILVPNNNSLYPSIRYVFHAVCF